MKRVTTEVRFSIVPEWILDADISDRAVRIYGILARYADSETLEAFPSRQTLAKRAHCHIKSVDRAIEELEKIGALKKSHRKIGDSYASNLYVLRRVVTPESLGRDTAVSRVGTPESLGRDTSVHLTRTIELEPEKQEPLSRSKPKNADDYEPSEKIRNTFDADWPGLRLDLELEKFKDYHASKGSTFKDWDRAFKTWLRKASEWNPEAKRLRAWAEFEKETERLIAEEEGNQ